MGDSRDSEDHRDDGQGNTCDGEYDDQEGSSKTNRPHLTVREKFFSVHVKGLSFYVRKLGFRG